ncbi:MAG: helix-turn-helix transcriptional regulator [Candidatus Shapirobacteria bacterium]|nr:helix-turn-helix transcriptional regulator [Candidatus Shapirobacteria bacterium]
MRKNAKLPKLLGKRIQKMRKIAGLTQEGLAEKVNVSRAYIGYIEQARNSPSLELLEKIARILKIDLKDLF